MKQVFLKKGAIFLDDVPEPICGPNEVLVACNYSAISKGTELSIIEHSAKGGIITAAMKNVSLLKKGLEIAKEKGFKKTYEMAKEKQEKARPLGYSCAGYVIAVGDKITDLRVGDKVACGGATANHAEVVSVPRNLVAKVPDNVPLEDAAFTTIGAIAIQGLRRANCQFGETVIIYGVGLLGLIAIQVAKAAGYKVIAIDINEKRISQAKEFGAELTLIVGKDDIEKSVYKFTEGHGADAVIIYASTKSSELINFAMKLVRKKGKIVIVGAVGLGLERPVFYEKELDVLMSTSYGPGRYDPLYEEKGLDYPIAYVRWTENRNMKSFLDLLSMKKIDIKPLISKIFSIDSAVDAYTYVSTNRDAVGVLLEYNPEKRYLKKLPHIEISRLHQLSIALPVKKLKDTINVAIIGVGNFARNYILPNLKKIPYFNIYAIVTRKPHLAKEYTKKYSAKLFTTDYHELLDNDEIDLIINATRHNLHYQIVKDTILSGKPIFTEKPLCLNEKELDDILDALNTTKTHLFVGFNRRYAPLILRAKQILSNIDKPYFINYRVNAGFIPKSHWVHDLEVGGGRIIGEACHFFDLFNFFVQSDIKKISAVAIPVNEKNVIDNDNFAATITWADGSITTLSYVSLGKTALEKERIEIFTDKVSIVINDFKTMNVYHEKNVENYNLKTQDKGHYNQFLNLGMFFTKGKGELITLEEIVKATKMSFVVDRLVKG